MGALSRRIHGLYETSALLNAIQQLGCHLKLEGAIDCVHTKQGAPNICSMPSKALLGPWTIEVSLCLSKHIIRIFSKGRNLSGLNYF